MIYTCSSRRLAGLQLVEAGRPVGELDGGKEEAKEREKGSNHTSYMLATLFPAKRRLTSYSRVQIVTRSKDRT